MKREYFHYNIICVSLKCSTILLKLTLSGFVMLCCCRLCDVWNVSNDVKKREPHFSIQFRFGCVGFNEIKTRMFMTQNQDGKFMIGQLAFVFISKALM